MAIIMAGGSRIILAGETRMTDCRHKGSLKCETHPHLDPPLEGEEIF